MTIGIISGGSVDLDFVKSFQSEVDCFIAADHGMDAARKLGIIPQMILGDFDSASEESLAYFRRFPEVRWEKHPVEKDETDTELALRLAVERKPDRILLFGATGTRLDHTMGNIQILKQALDAGVPAQILDPHNRIYLVQGSRTFFKKDLFGDYLSFLPFAGEVRGVTLTGFRYPLQDADVKPGLALTVSNELACETGTLTIQEGILICFETRD